MDLQSSNFEKKVGKQCFGHPEQLGRKFQQKSISIRLTNPYRPTDGELTQNMDGTRVQTFDPDPLKCILAKHTLGNVCLASTHQVMCTKHTLGGLQCSDCRGVVLSRDRSTPYALQRLPGSAIIP